MRCRLNVWNSSSPHQGTSTDLLAAWWKVATPSTIPPQWTEEYIRPVPPLALLTNSKMSISPVCGQPCVPVPLPMSQNAGHSPLPVGIFIRASTTPCLKVSKRSRVVSMAVVMTCPRSVASSPLRACRRRTPSRCTTLSEVAGKGSQACESLTKPGLSFQHSRVDQVRSSRESPSNSSDQVSSKPWSESSPGVGTCFADPGEAAGRTPAPTAATSPWSVSQMSAGPPARDPIRSSRATTTTSTATRTSTAGRTRRRSCRLITARQRRRRPAAG